MKHNIITKTLFLLVSMIAIVGCAEPPAKVVIKDESGLVLHTLQAIDDLEDKTGADLFGEVVTSTNPRYYRGKTPHRKVIAIEFVDHVKENNGEAVGVSHANLRGTKCLIQIERGQLYTNLIAHELLHCKGVDHDNEPNSLMGDYAPEGDYSLSNSTLGALGLL